MYIAEFKNKFDQNKVNQIYWDMLNFDKQATVKHAPTSYVNKTNTRKEMLVS